MKEIIFVLIILLNIDRSFGQKMKINDSINFEFVYSIEKKLDSVNRFKSYTYLNSNLFLSGNEYHYFKLKKEGLIKYEFVLDSLKGYSKECILDFYIIKDSLVLIKACPKQSQNCWNFYINNNKRSVITWPRYNPVSFNPFALDPLSIDSLRDNSMEKQINDLILVANELKKDSNQEND